MKSDREFIREYAANGSQTAFAELVKRHASLVFATCRRILSDPHEAEDASQATFLVLTRKASKLTRVKSLPGWLFLVARGCARNALRKRALRTRREREAAMRRAEISTEPAAIQELGEGLDEAIASLPAAQRDVVVLRCLSGLSAAEAAGELGCPPSTVATRLSRALKKLRGRLGRKGVSVSAAVLSAFLNEQKAQAAPGSLINSIQAACIGNTGASVLANELAEGVMKAMLWAKAKTAATVTAVAVFLIIITGLTISGINLKANAEPNKAAQAGPSETGKPDGKAKNAADPAPADESGRKDNRKPADKPGSKKGTEPKSTEGWLAPIKGKVTTEDGKPIAGAQVKYWALVMRGKVARRQKPRGPLTEKEKKEQEKKRKEDERKKKEFWEKAPITEKQYKNLKTSGAATTGKDGCFETEPLPIPGRFGKYGVGLSCYTVEAHARGFVPQNAQYITPGEYDPHFRLRAGKSLTGRVLEKGTKKPVKGAVVCALIGDVQPRSVRIGYHKRDGVVYNTVFSASVVTDNKGEFAFVDGLPLGRVPVYVQSVPGGYVVGPPGSVPRWIDIKNMNMKTQEMVFNKSVARASGVKLLVLDAGGAPVKGASIYYNMPGASKQHPCGSSDVAGETFLDKLKPGRYYFSARSGTYGFAEAKLIVLKSGGRCDVTLQFPHELAHLNLFFDHPEGETLLDGAKAYIFTWSDNQKEYMLEREGVRVANSEAYIEGLVPGKKMVLLRGKTAKGTAFAKKAGFYVKERETADVEITCTPGRTFEGTLTDSNGAVEGLLIAIYPNKQDYYLCEQLYESSLTDKNGRFAIGGLAEFSTFTLKVLNMKTETGSMYTGITRTVTIKDSPCEVKMKR